MVKELGEGKTPKKEGRGNQGRVEAGKATSGDSVTHKSRCWPQVLLESCRSLFPLPMALYYHIFPPPPLLRKLRVLRRGGRRPGRGKCVSENKMTEIVAVCL